MASHDKRKNHQHPRGGRRRIPRAEATRSPLNGPDQVGAFLQEIKAGAAPLTNIVTVPAEIPVPADPDRVTVATVPFLTTPLIPWNKVVTGDSLQNLVHLLHQRGGLWLARRTTATIDWTVGPTADLTDPNTPQPDQPEPWVRVDFRFTGAWNGRFALASPAQPLSQHLWCIAASPLIGVLPDEAVTKALPAQPAGQPTAWDEFTRSLDNALHATTNPSQAVRRLVVTSRWAGAHKLTDS